ncbi:MAG: twin-arginine translocase subunit TatC [Phycisphaerales bacterium]|nr:twin-arginine translocase subunit TatC [Phycisphaerales bacterium]
MPLPSDPRKYTMGLGDHIEDLRKRVIAALILPLPLAIALFFVADWLLAWLILPLQKVQLAGGWNPTLQVLSPPEFLLLEMKLSIVVALVLALPWILWQAWRFIAPGLYPHERRFVYLLVPGSFVLVIAGLSLLFYVMLPLILQVLMLFASGIETPQVLMPLADATQSAVTAFPSGRPEHAAIGQAWLADDGRSIEVAVTSTKEGMAQILTMPLEGRNAISQVYRLSSYVDFVLALSLGIAVAFQLPLAVLLLSWIGIVNVDMLRKRRSWALLICAVVAALTTPSDVFSMLIMLIPLYLLYELGILLAKWLPASRLAGSQTDGEAEA